MLQSSISHCIDGIITLIIPSLGENELESYKKWRSRRGLYLVKKDDNLIFAVTPAGAGAAFSLRAAL